MSKVHFEQKIIETRIKPQTVEVNSASVKNDEPAKKNKRETQGVIAPPRKVYETTKPTKTPPAPVETSKERIAMLLAKSKNPKADYNNPNNPYYNGKLASKLIESYLPNKAITKPAPVEKV